ncbi:hypothetical protein SAMN06265361_10292 [Laceyella tengchongensis]|uniref:Uncharacterized protein n=1 Tax=Laceyella tengchongensis TaxID=574699 RepID=A0AA45WKY1_9BACL|nr:hypothetical protein [Laceyella tengchongensis]SMP09403.1 hypothetical protein SAMN06265361_10292 [Laceyella tengchongensis]
MIHMEKVELEQLDLPFSLKEPVKYALSIYFEGEKQEKQQNLISFIELQDQFPICLVIEPFCFMEEEIEERCIEENISYKTIKSRHNKYYLIDVNKAFVKEAFTWAYELGSNNQFVGWAPFTNSFFEMKEIETSILGLFKKKTCIPSVQLSKCTTFFWIGFDVR